MMISYPILFIDEDPREIEKFQRYARLFEGLQVIPLEPLADKQEMIAKILNMQVFAVISDYDLTEKMQINYYGNDIVEALLKIKPHFPVFVFTNHEGDAFKYVESVHFVYDKKFMNKKDKKDKEKFLNLVYREIQKYLKRIAEAKVTFAALQEKRQQQSLSPKEEEQLLALDDFLEKSTTNRKNTLPKTFKGAYITQLNTLIQQTDQWIQELHNKPQ